LHLEDLPLLREGRMGIEHLITLRRGELAWDQPAQELRPLEEELIKLRGVSDADWRCVFYEERGQGCGVYESRPAECRALACWDTRALEAMYARDRARRSDILTTSAGLWPLIEEHERRCSLPELGELAAVFLNGDASAEDEILARVRYDAALREAFAARALAAESGLEQAMAFFFGRPLASVLARYGLGVRQEERALKLTRVKTPHNTWGGWRSACI
jgi:Fe-S-cluster containining protein